MPNDRIAFAGDRDISVWVLDFILSKGIKPLALLIPYPAKASHANELVQRCNFLPEGHILFGEKFRDKDGVTLLQGMALDYIIGVHFPYVVPSTVLSVPKLGFLNLHPAYLPYNRGWHTPSWAILEGSTIGASLHVMDPSVDTGDIIFQEPLEVSPGDTADSLYQKVKRLEFEVFKTVWPHLLDGGFKRVPQDHQHGSSHKRKDLLREEIQRIDLEQSVKATDLIRKLRALSTNRIEEAAYYEVGGRRFRIQVKIQEEANG